MVVVTWIRQWHKTAPIFNFSAHHRLQCTRGYFHSAVLAVLQQDHWGISNSQEVRGALKSCAWRLPDRVAEQNTYNQKTSSTEELEGYNVKHIIRAHHQFCTFTPLGSSSYHHQPHFDVIQSAVKFKKRYLSLGHVVSTRTRAPARLLNPRPNPLLRIECKDGASSLTSGSPSGLQFWDSSFQC